MIILNGSHFVEACNCYLCLSSEFQATVLQIYKNRILSLFIRAEMFLKILTKWPFQAIKKNYVREI